ncbi:spinster family MFS transporter [Crossiella equi]|nr:MFS transporter [Crossiella equi]
MVQEEFLRETPASGPGQKAARRILVLLFLANLFNFFDRVMPAIVIEEIRRVFGLNDTQVGLMSSAFTVVYALAGLPLGRLADRAPRRVIIGWGLAFWSVLTAATAGALGFWSLLLVRLGVGVGEASYAPAASSLIADLYPPNKRARATGIFMLGLPIGLTLAYFTVGGIAEAFGSWRAPFLLAAVPGLLLALAFFRVKEPLRGAAELTPTAAAASAPSTAVKARALLTIPTLWCLIVAFIGHNFASYSVNTFTVPLLQRYFGLSLSLASVLAGVIMGVTGLVGLLVGGRLADRAGTSGRVLLGAACLIVAAPLTLLALTFGPEAATLYTITFATAWLLGYVFFNALYPALADVIEPRRRATATAVMFAMGYLLGGGAGPIIVGALSDSYAAAAA